MNRAFLPFLPPRAPSLISRRLASTRRSLPRPSSSPRKRSSLASRRSTAHRLSSPTTAKPDAPAATTQTVRRVVLTGAVALVTVVGAITGARLKTDRDTDKQRHEVEELSLEERIAMLESRRAGLVNLKMPLERKLAGLRERMETENEDEGGAEGRP